MGIHRGKRKRGLSFAQRKRTTYLRNKQSPFPKRLKTSPSIRTSTQYKKVSPSKCHTPHSSRKRLFDTSFNEIEDILYLTGEFSILDISDFQNNSSVNGFGYTNAFSSSVEPSNKESKDHKLEKENCYKVLLSGFRQEISLNNIALQLWCVVVDCTKIQTLVK